MCFLCTLLSVTPLCVSDVPHFPGGGKATIDCEERLVIQDLSSYGKGLPSQTTDACLNLILYRLLAMMPSATQEADDCALSPAEDRQMDLLKEHNLIIT